MKNISNSPPFNLDVTNNLTVGNDLEVKNTIAASTIGATTVNATNLNSQSLTTNTINAQSILLNGTPLLFSAGSWTPLFKVFRGFRDGSPLVKESWNGVYDNITAGTYTKVGKAVTIWFSVKCSFSGFQNDVLFAPKYPIVDNLPFRCNDPSTQLNLVFEADCSNVQYPNNYIGAFPVPLVTTYEGNYSLKLSELGTTFIPQIPPFYDPSGLDTAVLDGKTIIFECRQASSIPAVADWTKEGTVTNAPVLALGNYTIAFTGSVTYFTDE